MAPWNGPSHTVTYRNAIAGGPVEERSLKRAVFTWSGAHLGLCVASGFFQTVVEVVQLSLQFGALLLHLD